jgi:hypothetical protein
MVGPTEAVVTETLMHEPDFDPALHTPEEIELLHKLRDSFAAALQPYIGQTNVTDEMLATVKAELVGLLPPAEPPTEITFDPTKQTEDRLVATIIFKDPRLIAEIRRQQALQGNGDDE